MTSIATASETVSLATVAASLALIAIPAAFLIAAAALQVARWKRAAGGERDKDGAPSESPVASD